MVELERQEMKMHSVIVKVPLTRTAPPLPCAWQVVKLHVFIVQAILEQTAPPVPPLYVVQLVKLQPATVKELPWVTYIPPPLESVMVAVQLVNVALVKETLALELY